MTTGERIKELRKEKGITAEDLAKDLGVSPATIYRYEKGDIEKVPVDVLKGIAVSLGTTPEYLMGWADRKELSEDDELMALREQLRRSPETRMLFDVTRHATPEQIKSVAEMLKQWRSLSD